MFNISMSEEISPPPNRSVDIPLRDDTPKNRITILLSLFRLSLKFHSLFKLSTLLLERFEDLCMVFHLSST